MGTFTAGQSRVFFRGRNVFRDNRGVAFGVRHRENTVHCTTDRVRVRYKYSYWHFQLKEVCSSLKL